MRVFLTWQIDNNEELYTQLGRVESELVAVRIAAVDAEKAMRELQEGVQAVKAEACRMEEEKKVVETKCKDTEQERDQLNKELEDLRAASEA